MNLLVLLHDLDPWAIVVILLALLWAVEVRFGQRSSYMKGKADGYSMAARHLHEGQVAAESER